MQVFGKDYTEQEILYAYLNLCFQISTCQNEKFKNSEGIASLSEEDKVEAVKQMGVRVLTGLQATKEAEFDIPAEVESYMKMVEEVFAASVSEVPSETPEAAPEEETKE